MKVLIVEDEAALAKSIADFLSRSGAIVESASTLDAGLRVTARNPYDCILLDVMLPDGNGLDILKAMKRANNDAGIIVISAKNSLTDKVRGLALGADDYLTKPFQLVELNARIHAVVRRKKHEGKPVVAFREIEIDTFACQARVHATPVPLTRKEYDLLLFFMANKNRVLSKESIAEHLWGDYILDAAAFDFIYAHVKNLRKKIQQAGGRDYITTVHGLGYVMKE
jgi:DNA-binding response OmpR family regulator